MRAHKSKEQRPAAVVRTLPVARDGAAMVAGLRAGERWARAALFDAHGPRVKQVLRRVLGPGSDVDLPDLVHDVFVEALRSVGGLRDGDALSAWVQSIAVHVALREIRRRKRRRWLRFWEPSSLDQFAGVSASATAHQALARTYATLDRLEAKSRVAFALRYIEGLELAEVAASCGVSLATIKRRLDVAEKRFVTLAVKDDVLRVLVQEGGRWTT
jgi:RNA polymerase sigma-70 factor (ECF subfamily)